MIWGQVGIAHGHRQICMSQATLQHQDISAIHHEMRSKGVTQNMGELAFLELNVGSLDGFSECRIARGKKPLTSLLRIVMSF